MSDYSENIEAEKRLRNAIRKIHSLAVAVGHAKQVREYDSDRRKNLLAKYAMESVMHARTVKQSTGTITAPLKSVAAAEMDARANPAYNAELEALAGQYEASLKTIAEWESAFASYEAARSILSLQKETMRTIE